MGKIRKCKLSWKPSESELHVGYRLYWATETPVDYKSNYIKLGNITEVNLPDILVGKVTPGASIYLGISAINIVGNESDIITLSEPYNFSVPVAPADLTLITLDDFMITAPRKKVEGQDSEKQALPPSDQPHRHDGQHPALKFATADGKIVDDFDFRMSTTFEEQ